MKEIITPPGARRLITSLRDMGYSFSGAVADLVDNSISAGATRVYVNIHALEGTAPPHIVVAGAGSSQIMPDPDCSYTISILGYQTIYINIGR